MAEINGAASEEFNIEHFHVFSPKSLSYLLKISNLRLLHMSRIKEKSGKYTIYCFAIKDLNAVWINIIINLLNINEKKKFV